MADYKKMYIKLAQTTETVIRQLIEAQRECEEIYIESVEAEINDTDMLTYHDENADKE